MDDYLELLLILWDAACAPGRKPVMRRRAAPGARYCSLRPGADTPLWNQLVRTLRPLLARYGAKAALARELGVPRQRVHDFLVGHSALPDAERALFLVAWAARRWRGGRTQKGPAAGTVAAKVAAARLERGFRRLSRNT